MTVPAEHVTLEELARLLDRWQHDGLVTPDQAKRILDAETRLHQAPAARPRTAEALGYVGGVLILLSGLLLAGRYWRGIALGGRLVLTGVVAAALLAVAAAVPAARDPAAARLRQVLGALSAVAFAGFLAVLGWSGLHWAADDTVSLVAAGTTAYAAVLWWWLGRNSIQHVVLLASVLTLAGSAAAHLPAGSNEIRQASVGLAVWGAASNWVVLGWGGLLPPRVVAMIGGAAGAIVGSQVATSLTWGHAVALVTVVAIVTAAVVRSDLLLLAVGGLGLLVAIPSSIERFFPDSSAAPVALLATGLVIVALALRGILWRRRDRVAVRSGLGAGSPRVALGVAAAVAATVVVAELLLTSL